MNDLSKLVTFLPTFLFLECVGAMRAAIIAEGLGDVFHSFKTVMFRKKDPYFEEIEEILQMEAGFLFTPCRQ